MAFRYYLRVRYDECDAQKVGLQRALRRLRGPRGRRVLPGARLTLAVKSLSKKPLPDALRAALERGSDAVADHAGYDAARRTPEESPA